MAFLEASLKNDKELMDWFRCALACRASTCTLPCPASAHACPVWLQRRPPRPASAICLLLSALRAVPTTGGLPAARCLSFPAAVASCHLRPASSWCRQRLVWDDPAVVNDLLKKGLFTRIYEPQARPGCGGGGRLRLVFALQRRCAKRIAAAGPGSRTAGSAPSSPCCGCSS